MGLTPPLPPLPPPTRVGPQGGPYASGDVPIIAGVGMAARAYALGAGVVLDGSSVDPDAPAALFIPDAATWPEVSLRLIGESYLRLAEALVVGDPPPAGTDGSNHYALRWTGSVSGEQTLGLSTVGGREYRFDGYAINALGAQDANPGSENTPFGIAYAQPIKLSADATAATVGWKTWGGLPKWNDHDAVRYVVLDADRNRLAETEVFDPRGTGTYEWVDRPLTSSVDLAQGARYLIGLECVGLTTDTRTGQNSGLWSGVLVNPDSPGVLLTQPADGDPADAALATTPASSDPNARGAVRIGGYAGGVLLTGDVAVEVVPIGAPPAPAPTSVNLRMQWGTIDVGGGA